MVAIVRDRADPERKFYTRMAIAMAVIVFLGFAPSFYLFQLFSYPRPNPILTPLTIVHGVVFTIWTAVFIAQTQFVDKGRRDLHMKLGAAAMFVPVVMAILMYQTGVGLQTTGNKPPFIDVLSFTALPLLDIPAFIVFVAMGWWNRRTAQVHKRFMLLAMLRLMEPALSRLPLFPPTFAGSYATAAVAWLMIVPLAIWDRRQLGHIHWVTKFGAVITAGTTLFRFMVWRTDGWHHFVQMLPRW